MICTHKYYSSDEIKKKNENAEACDTWACGETRNSCRFLAGKPEGKKLLGRSRGKWGVILK